jgi:hypothetical protein
MNYWANEATSFFTGCDFFVHRSKESPVGAVQSSFIYQSLDEGYVEHLEHHFYACAGLIRGSNAIAANMVVEYIVERERRGPKLAWRGKRGPASFANVTHAVFSWEKKSEKTRWKRDRGPRLVPYR